MESSGTKLKLSLDLRAVIIVLLAVIGVMLFLWKPWASGASDRTITVTGEATVEAEPDEFIFYPAYEFKGTDKSVLLADLNKKNEEIVAKLKELGIPDDKIKNNASNYDWNYYYNETDKSSTYTLQLTINAGSREEAQKVQDYLITTTPTGQISPQSSFSDNKRKELESKARDEATKDARSKADQSAANLGFKVGSVKSVEDGSGFGVMPYPMLAEDSAVNSNSRDAKLTIQPGTNELNYTVTVAYFVR